MITSKGKEIISRYLAGLTGQWAGAMELGVGSTSAELGDTSLEFPIVRAEVNYLDYNPLTHRVTARATLSDEVAGSFYEVAIFNQEDYPDQSSGNQIILDFSQEDTSYATLNANISSSNARVGSNGILVSVPAASTGYVRGYRPGLDLSNFSGGDVINLAYFYTDTAGAPTVTVRFETTLEDYYEASFTPTVDYNIETFSRESMTTTGSPSWSDVSGVYLLVTGESDILLDGIMIEGTINTLDYGMVAREVLTSPIIKTQFNEVEVTFTLDIGF
jgi:hypothetical protein